MKNVSVEIHAGASRKNPMTELTQTSGTVRGLRAEVPRARNSERFRGMAVLRVFARALLLIQHRFPGNILHPVSVFRGRSSLICRGSDSRAKRQLIQSYSKSPVR